MEFIAEIMEYVTVIQQLCTGKDKSARPLNDAVPLHGPYFMPHNSYLEGQKRERSPQITLDVSYLKPVTVVHPYFFGERLLRCPNVKPTALKTEVHEVAWDGWTTTGHREVHGLWREETAIRYQLRCKTCQRASQMEGTHKRIQYCFATMSSQFWQYYEHWQIPRYVPYFLHRCVVTRELYNLIIEFRPSMTASAMEEHIKQCHLLEFLMCKAEYVEETAKSVRPGQQMTLDGGPRKIIPYSAPKNKKGYNDRNITHDLISDIYLDFVRRTREEESSAYLCTLTAKIVHKDGSRKDLMSGGLFSAVNERNEIILWAFCQTTSGEEFGKPLRGYRLRCETKGVALSQTATSDICCKVRRQVQENLSEEVAVVQDVNHFSGRYACSVQDKTSNPHHAAVWRSVTDSILEERAENGKPAVYYSQQEQVKRLEDMYARWDRKGNVWTAASVKCHAEQMKHARKGCLARPRNDMRSDGSRIEGTHRGWNSLMRASPSGLEMLVALGHDHVLWRNTRVILRSKEFDATPFLTSTFGSHHLSLINHIAQTWNAVVNRLQGRRKAVGISASLELLPTMEIVHSGEKFGLIEADHITTFGGLWEVKVEEDDESSFIDLSDLSIDDCEQRIGTPHTTTSIDVSATTAATSSTPIIQSRDEHARPDVVSGDNSLNPIDVDSSALTAATGVLMSEPSASHISQSSTPIDLTDGVTLTVPPAEVQAIEDVAFGTTSASSRKRKLSALNVAGGSSGEQAEGEASSSSRTMPAEDAVGSKKARMTSAANKRNVNKVRSPFNISC
ncbi:hypothetical protein NM688_g8119 [Phlebia brevispora]|uniref:Uncharacterized protein n=1 Tax=Phlebia brevispora TaxID=194682 RepID=A0ACC1RX58_9APHY|nr:hypothetical protein NM688_g8119 [Phlebia brevispora]